MLETYMKICAGSGWDAVNILHSSSYIAMFGTFYKNTVGNKDVLVIAEQCFTRTLLCKQLGFSY